MVKWRGASPERARLPQERNGIRIMDFRPGAKGESFSRALSRSFSYLAGFAFLYLFLPPYLPAGDARAEVLFQDLGAHPYAAAQPDEWGRTLSSLYPFDGKLYAGYGTAGHDIAPWDPDADAFLWEWEARTAEGCFNYRAWNGRLFAPSNQVEASVDYSVGTPWEDGDVPSGLHLYDMNRDDAGDLWIVGSSGSLATAWKSEDDGASWQAALQVAPLGGTYARFYFVGVYRGNVYVQAIDNPEIGPHPTSLVWEGAGWEEGPDLLPYASSPGNNYTRGQGWRPEEFGGRMLYTKWGAYGIGNSGLLYAFDGTTADTVFSRYGVKDFTVAEDRIWILDRFDEIWSGTDLDSLEPIGNAPVGARSVGMLGGAVYVGTTDSHLFRGSMETGVRRPGRRDTPAFRIVPARPNPFNGSTVLSFDLREPSEVVLSVHDTRGRLVALLEDTILGGGSHAFLWDGRDGEGSEVPSGAYFARVLAAGEERTMKLLLIR
jgi:hypothetical protein